MTTKWTGAAINQKPLCARLPAAVRAGAWLVTVVVSMSVVVVNGTPAALATVDLSGTTVVLDPGHNGVNDAANSEQVPNGRGGMKPCNTSGTTATDGYPEHSFTWDVALKIRNALDHMGVHTTMTRDSDTGVGPCVDRRASLANAAKPDAIVSIHADGGPVSGQGFHVNYSAPPLNDVQAGPAVRLATTMRDALVAAGLHEANYIGAQGLYGRADLAGLNLAQYPAILVELGNMKNAEDAGQMESADGRAKYAAVVSQGIIDYLGTRVPAR